jgi:hypothetical protein
MASHKNYTMHFQCVTLASVGGVAENQWVIVKPNIPEDGSIRPKHVEKENHVVYLYHELCIQKHK